ncbi:MAG: hypothetical protein WDN69_06560 [Aliidongia sp.]
MSDPTCLDRVAHHQDETRIGKQPEQIAQARDQVIALEHEPPALAQQQDLLQVLAIEALELRVLLRAVHYAAARRIMRVRKERHPDRFVERFGGFRP